MPKCKVLVGAPEAGQWSSADLSVDTFLPAFTGFCDAVHHAHLFGTSVLTHRTTASSPQEQGPAWRSLPLTTQYLPTGLSQRQWMRPGVSGYSYEESYGQHAKDDEKHGSQSREISFFAATDMEAGDAEELEDELSQFLEQSFALHDEVPLSQITTDEADETVTSLDLSTFPEMTVISNFSTSHDTAGASPPSLSDLPSPYHSSLIPPKAPHLTSLNLLPSAAHLIRINPQTMTVDLICGIISISAPRSVTVRRTGKSVDLVELPLGDETRAGLAFTCWVTSSEDLALKGAGLSSKKSHLWADKDYLRNSLNNLRRGDVVLIRNVALAQFRGVVHGQSLRWRSTRAQGTLVELLYRKGGHMHESKYARYHRDVEKSGGGAVYDTDASSSNDEGPGADAQISEKLMRVKDWVTRFVGPMNYEITNKRDGQGRAKKRRRISLDELPPDTQ